jgi:hypothetical protein
MSLAPYVLKGATKRALGIFNFVVHGTTSGITASTTHTIAGGTPLTSEVNVISTCANAGDAVTLPALTVGQTVDIFNNGAAAAAVYPATSSYTIDGGSAGASVTLTNAKRCRYLCVAANTIISAQLGVVSA